MRILLLAESHVFTHEHELVAQVRLEPHGHSDAPSRFVRLVYCLGYGEPGIAGTAVRPDVGTPQFWKLFAACVDDPPDGNILKGVERRLAQRIKNKISLLEDLQARGVWLLDASPAALYRPGGGKVHSTVRSAPLDVIPQPQAHVSAAEHRDACRKLCDYVRRFGRRP